ncbi:unnamed protein product [Urochloa humidicola]
MVSPPRKPSDDTPPPKKKMEKPESSGNGDGKKAHGRRSPSRKPSQSRSPSCHRGSRHHDTEKPRERVVERVVREAGSSDAWPQLTKTNYVEWSLRMKLKLQAHDLWDVIEFGDGDFRDDRTVLDAICRAVPSEMIPALAVKDTATEAIKTLRLGDERQRAVTVQTLRAEYETIKLRDGEAIEEFALRFAGVVQRLAELGDPEPDVKAVKKYLRVIRPRYKHLVIPMEAFVDLSTLTIEDITGTLKSSSDADVEVVPPSNSSLGTGRKLMALRTDHGGEFTSIDFGRYCAERGVHRQLTAPYSAQQNGVVERRNQSVVSMARCMMKAKHLPGYFWGEAVSTAVHILNRAPTRALDGKTPFEAWRGERPPVHYFKTFGCLAYVKNTRPGLKKLEDRSTPMIFVGYENGSKAYCFYNPDNGRVVISRDAVFDEAGEWKWNQNDDADTADQEPFVIEYTEIVRSALATERGSSASPRTLSPAAVVTGTPE